MTTTDKFHLAFALNATGQIPDATAGAPATPDHWEAILRRIEGQADFVTLEDHFGEAADGFDAGLLANRLGPVVRGIGIIPGAVLNYNEPFHVSTTIATLDYVTEGRAGLLAQRLRPQEAAAVVSVVGRLNGFPEPVDPDLDEDARDAVEVIRRLWDSWEDDAVIRDAASQRFIDGSKLHYIDFKGKRFSVLGPSIVPRPPQGQPVVAVSARDAADLAFAAETADVVFLQPGDTPPGDFIAQAREAQARAARSGPLRHFLDVAVSFDGDSGARGAALGWSGAASDLVAQLTHWRAAGADGFRLIPRDLARDLAGLTEVVIPALRDAGRIYEVRNGTLRQSLGLPAAVNRHIAAA
ncbi:MAG: LLM class flavin-dependent oxidoreductase [Pseudochelatococcus sp.]|jgi:alkanesulfonate monooxygenase SsuD/methylene tetrahydromethanopterin reductase-like flavin-dependent oxidoreductase (luciferase family)|uniref:LLM class flavin-dependent oxidoreductase n=1 Tax=Pseudochelatococcus sp. TaxID=2020869 RepID=UPI003D949A41